MPLGLDRREGEDTRSDSRTMGARRHKNICLEGCRVEADRGALGDSTLPLGKVECRASLSHGFSLRSRHEASADSREESGDRDDQNSSLTYRQINSLGGQGSNTLRPLLLLSPQQKLTSQLIEKHAHTQSTSLSELQAELRSLKTLLQSRSAALNPSASSFAPPPAPSSTSATGSGTASGNADHSTSTSAAAAGSGSTTPTSISATTEAANKLLLPKAGKGRGIPAWQMAMGSGSGSGSTSGVVSKEGSDVEGSPAAAEGKGKGKATETGVGQSSSEVEV